MFVDLIKGNGERFLLCITYDELHDLIDALKNVTQDVGLGKTKANESSYTYAYGFQIEGKEGEILCK
jgi:hypothetical protein